MTKVHLTDQEKAQIIEAINNDVEPEPDLVEKLFPRLVDKVDFKKLDRAKIPTLEYAGKRSEASILNETLLYEGGSPLQVERCFERGKTSDETQLDIFEKAQDDNPDNDWRNLIVQGDNLQFLKTCYQNTDPLIKDKVKGKVQLIYIDPPFGTGDEYGGKDGELSYSAKVMGADFIENIRERLIYAKNILASDGVIFVRQGYNFADYIKIIMDEIFDKTHFINEIIVNRGKQRLGGKKKYSTATDYVFFYSKSDDYLFKGFKRERYKGEAKGTNMLMKGDRNPPERIFYDTDGQKVTLLPPPNTHWKFVQPKIDEMYKKGVIYLAKSQKGLESGIRKIEKDKYIPVDYVPSFTFDEDKTIDSNWTDISGYDQTTGYPTENSENLLDRIINTSSEKGDLIMDFFGGSGTTAAVAEKLGRRWITCDFGKHSIYTMQKRILRIAESKALNEKAKNNEKYGKPPKPFCVVSCGAYDFSRIMNLKENKEAYINFVLGLFQLPREEKRLNEKFKLANIYGEKDGNPVEVFPVWDNEYLRNIKIDEEYLQEIIRQSGGRLKGVYYIITPETCTVVGDTVLQSGSGDEVHFKLLKFPYKILEDAARKFSIEEQPSSQENVNNLINSTGFYFNNDVEFEAERTADGLKVTKFNTSILDKNGNKYEGLNALAMLLVDINYNDEIFDMETTVFAKEIDDEGKCKVIGLTDSVAIIAIDKHGNESKPFILKA